MPDLLWNKALSKTISISNLWPQLHYVYQNPINGEFVASDNRVLLVENNGMPPLAEWWNPDGTIADVYGLEYVKYFDMILKIRNMPAMKSKGVILPEQLERVQQFIGAGGTIHTSGYYNYYVSADKRRQAVIYAFDEYGKWRLLNTSEELITECDSYEEAVNMGNILGCKYIIRRNK